MPPGGSGHEGETTQSLVLGEVAGYVKSRRLPAVPAVARG